MIGHRVYGVAPGHKWSTEDELAYVRDVLGRKATVSQRIAWCQAYLETAGRRAEWGRVNAAEVVAAVEQEIATLRLVLNTGGKVVH